MEEMNKRDIMPMSVLLAKFLYNNSIYNNCRSEVPQNCADFFQFLFSFQSEGKNQTWRLGSSIESLPVAVEV